MPAAPIERRVTVQDLVPLARTRHTDPKIMSGYWRKVARDDEQLLGRPCAPEIAERTLVGIVAIDPLRSVLGNLDESYRLLEKGEEIELKPAARLQYDVHTLKKEDADAKQ